MRAPVPVTDCQGCLFHSDFSNVLAELCVSMDELARWHAKGWISFDGNRITEVATFDDPRVCELTVVRDVVRSGLNDAQIDHLLAQLPRPCVLNPSRLVFSFQYGWVEVEPSPKVDRNEIIENHLDDWLETCGEDWLRELQKRIEELLELAAAEAEKNAE